MVSIKSGGVVLGAAAIMALGAAGGAIASGQITAHQMATGAATHRVIADGSVHSSDMSQWLNTKVNRADLHGAIFRVANYTQGGGGRATVACASDDAVSQRYTAISGGAYVTVGDGSSTDTEPITSSRPGRMDWSTNTPKPNRLDGWIVNFGSGAAPGNAPGDVLQVWALCVPNNTFPTQTTNY